MRRWQREQFAVTVETDLADAGEAQCNEAPNGRGRSIPRDCGRGAGKGRPGEPHVASVTSLESTMVEPPACQWYVVQVACMSRGRSPAYLA
jgi:hypothetical protein